MKSTAFAKWLSNILTQKMSVFLILVFVIPLIYQNCAKMQFEYDSSSFDGLNKVADFCEENPNTEECVNPPSPVCLFNGVEVAEGQSVTSYLHSSVPSDQSCQSEERLCRSGALSGSFQYASCEVGQRASCLFNGQSIQHGQSVVGYQSSSVSNGQSCAPETRLCENGVLSGSYQYASCSVGQLASCLFNGQSIPHGQSVLAYLTSTVASNQTCQYQTRQCLNGVLQGTYNYSSCSTNQPASCSFGGQTYAHQQTVQAFLNSTVPYGHTCQSETRICSNGALSGSYNNSSCVVSDVASCSFNGQTIAHGQPVVGYLTSTVPFGQTCSGRQMICIDGNLAGKEEYKFASCLPGEPAACLFNGRTIAHGQSVTAYENSTVPFGSSCASQQRVCQNGILTGSFSSSSCVVGQASGCRLNASREMVSGQTLQVYQSATVPYMSTCHSENVTCTNGQLTGSSYRIDSCQVEQPAPTTTTTTTTISTPPVSPTATSFVDLAQSVSEGGSITFKFNSAAPNGTQFRYEILKTAQITQEDFDTPINGTVNVWGGVGSLTVKLRNDYSTEGNHTFTMRVYNTDGSVGVEGSVVIYDSSTAGAVSVDRSSLDEGTYPSMNVSFSGYPDGVSVKYRIRAISPGLNSSDISQTQLDTQYEKIISSGKISVPVFPLNDYKTEGTEEGILEIWGPDGALVHSHSFSIIDKSLSGKVVSVEGNSQIGEGDPASSIKVNFSGFPSGLSIRYKIRGVSPGLTSDDFIVNTKEFYSPKTSAATIASNSISISIGAIADYSTESNESGVIEIIAPDDSILHEIPFTIVDKSQSVSVVSVSGPSTVNEGESATYAFTISGPASGLKYRIGGSLNSQDLGEAPISPSSASVSISAGKVSIVVRPVADYKVEGDESGYIELLDSNNNVLRRHDFVVKDTSALVISSVSGPSSIDEDNVSRDFVFNVSGVPNGLTMYYRIRPGSIGNLTSSDLNIVHESNSASGVTVSAGKIIIRVVAKADSTTEGVESAMIEILGPDNSFVGSHEFSINDTSKAGSVTILPPSRIEEGKPVVFTVNTTGFSDGTKLSYRIKPISSNLNSNDISGAFAPSSSVVTVSANKFLIQLSAYNDYQTEGVESGEIEILGVDQAVLGSQAFSIEDTSVSGSVTSIVPSLNSFTEGSSNTFTINTTGFPAGGSIRYRIRPISFGLSSSDLSGAAMQSSYSQVSLSSGVAKITLSSVADYQTEGDEEGELEILNMDNEVIKSQKFVLIDSSKLPTASISGSDSVNEGTTNTYTVSINGMNAGSTVIYRMIAKSGDLNSSDVNLIGGTYSGTVSSNKTITISLVTKADLVTEGAEVGTIEVMTSNGEVFATKDVSISDTSRTLTISGSVNTALTTYDEGSTVNFEVSSSGISDGTKLNYTFSGSGITSADINGAALSGQLTILGNKGTVSVSLKSGDGTENEVLVFTVTMPDGSNKEARVTIKDK